MSVHKKDLETLIAFQIAYFRCALTHFNRLFFFFFYCYFSYSKLQTDGKVSIENILSLSNQMHQMTKLMPTVARSSVSRRHESLRNVRQNLLILIQFLRK